jgi:hypothetical protein
MDGLNAFGLYAVSAMPVRYALGTSQPLECAGICRCLRLGLRLKEKIKPTSMPNERLSQSLIPTPPTSCVAEGSTTCKRTWRTEKISFLQLGITSARPAAPTPS